MFVPLESQNMASSGQKVSPVHMYGGGIWWGKNQVKIGGHPLWKKAAGCNLRQQIKI